MRERPPPRSARMSFQAVGGRSLWRTATRLEGWGAESSALQEGSGYRDTLTRNRELLGEPLATQRESVQRRPQTLAVPHSRQELPSLRNTW
jgi:hypothetical protein